jgi:hypothetical protein
MDLKDIRWEQSSGWGQGPVIGCCEQCDEPLGSRKFGYFLLAEQLLASKKDVAAAACSWFI